MHLYAGEMSGAGDGVRLAEMVAALSLATDLGLGQPQEHIIRQTLIAMRMADLDGLSDDERAAIFYVSLLAWVGCVADAHEMGKWFGDDTGSSGRQLLGRHDRAADDALHARPLASGSSPIGRLTMIGRFLAGGSREVQAPMASHCETSGDLSLRLGLGPEVRDPLQQAFERWDGKGSPAKLAGLGDRPHHADRARRQRRRGTCIGSAGWTRRSRCSAPAGERSSIPSSSTASARMPTNCSRDRRGRRLGHPHRRARRAWGASSRRGARSGAGGLRRLRGHQVAVHARTLARRRGSCGSRRGHVGLPSDDIVLVRRAALVHDVGSIGVSAGILDKAGPLTEAERERIRTHPYLTARTFSKPPALATIGQLAAKHHERMDGSGYPAGLTADSLPMTARLIAAADVYHALLEPRPHRAAWARDEARKVLTTEVTGGRLDGDAVRAVLDAAGHRVRRKTSHPGGLTAREIEVLVLLSRGMTQKQIARELTISAKTVSNHEEHIYAKLGVRSRGAAALFAMRHGLIDVAAVD